jgi:hypothetical protein
MELRPYALGGAVKPQGLHVDARRDAGLDVKWGLTPGLTADFTVNTDFAQEEADIQQVNFTRFSLFFPEKRQFFLEGQQMFQFGVPREADLIFTRRIGLSPDGEILPITAGARLSGRVGRTGVGLMSLQTDDALGFPSENMSVLRVRRDLLGRSSVGAVLTNRQGGGRFLRTIGADASFYFDQAWQVEGFAARADDGGRGRSAAYGRVAYESDRIGAAYRYLDIDHDFDPGIGFVLRPDSRESFSEVRFSPRPRQRWIRQMHVRGAMRYITNQQNVLETRERRASVNVAFESGDIVEIAHTGRFESIAEPFRLRPDVSIAPGAYRFDTVTASFNTFRRRQARINLSVSGGGFWDGERHTVVADAYWRPSKHFGIGPRYEVNWVDLPRQAFVTHLVASRVEIAFSTTMILLPLLQYNADTQLFSTNIRFNWIPTPGSDFFIVYNELDDWARSLRMRNRSLVVKLNYRLAL